MKKKKKKPDYEKRRRIAKTISRLLRLGGFVILLNNAPTQMISFGIFLLWMSVLFGEDL